MPSGIRIRPLRTKFKLKQWQNRPVRLYLAAPDILHEPLVAQAEQLNIATYIVLRKDDAKPDDQLLAMATPEQPLLPPTSAVSELLFSLKESPVKEFSYLDQNYKFFSWGKALLSTCSSSPSPSRSSDLTRAYSPAKQDVVVELQVWNRENLERGESASLLLDLPTHLLPKTPTRPIKIDKPGLCSSGIQVMLESDKGFRVQSLYLIAIVKIGNTIYVSTETPFPAPSSRRFWEKPDKPTTPTENTALPVGVSHGAKMTASETNYNWQNVCADVLQVEVCTDALNKMLKRQCDLEPQVTTMEHKQLILDWITASRHFISKEDLILKLIAPHTTKRWFCGLISFSAASAVLAASCSLRPTEAIFLVRFSQSIPPFLAVNARYYQKGEQAQYSTRISVLADSHQETGLEFCIETTKDEDPSKRDSLLGVVEYIVSTTNWAELPRDFYDQSGLPPTFNPQLPMRLPTTPPTFDDFFPLTGLAGQPGQSNSGLSFGVSLPPMQPPSQAQAQALQNLGPATLGVAPRPHSSQPSHQSPSHENMSGVSFIYHQTPLQHQQMGVIEDGQVQPHLLPSTTPTYGFNYPSTGQTPPQPALPTMPFFSSLEQDPLQRTRVRRQVFAPTGPLQLPTSFTLLYPHPVPKLPAMPLMTAPLLPTGGVGKWPQTGALQWPTGTMPPLGVLAPKTAAGPSSTSSSRNRTRPKRRKLDSTRPDQPNYAESSGEDSSDEDPSFAPPFVPPK